MDTDTYLGRFGRLTCGFGSPSATRLACLTTFGGNNSRIARSVVHSSGGCFFLGMGES